MAFHLHMLNLREDATSKDIREVFSGLSIIQDGVTMVGGPKGEAFVTFGSKLDLIQALQKDGEQHLSLRVVTDSERLIGINRMCMIKLQDLNETDSLLSPRGRSKDEKHGDVQTADWQQGNYKDSGKRSQHFGSSECGNGYDSKQRRIDGNSHIKKSYDNDSPGQYTDNDQNYSQTQTAQPSSQKVIPDHSSIQNTAPAHAANQFQVGPYYPYAMPVQFPYQYPAGPYLHYPYNPGFQAQGSFNSIPGPLVQQTSFPKPNNAQSQGSLLLGLLPNARQQRYCIRVYDLPPAVTPSVVWSWVGGPQGTAIGAILLQAPNEHPVAFVIYDDQTNRDARFSLCNVRVSKFSMVETYNYITDFINNYPQSDGANKFKPCIWETTVSGKDHFVDLQTMSFFSKSSPAPSFSKNASPGQTSIQTLSGRDGTINPEERKQLPFLMEGNKQSQPNKEPFTLIDINMKYLCLKKIPCQSTTKVVWNAFPKASGVIIMKPQRSNHARDSEAVIAFKTVDDLFESMKDIKVKNKSARNVACPEAMLALSLSSYVMNISTEPNLPDRKLTIEEAKFIMSNKKTNKERIRAMAEPQKISIKSQATPQEEASFLHHLKALECPTENEPLYLMLHNMKRELTACDIHAIFPDALCAVKVNFDDNAFGPFNSKAIGYLLLKDIEECCTAKLVFENYFERWNQQSNQIDVPINTNLSKVCKRATVKHWLCRSCYKSTIAESSPSGLDRELSIEELRVAAMIPTFRLVHSPPCLHYAQLTLNDKDLSACDIWDMFHGPYGDVKGVALLINKINHKGYIACVAFNNLHSRDQAVDRIQKKGSQHWSSVLKFTEQQAMGFLMGASNYFIKISTEAGQDRDLESYEVDMLYFTKLEPTTKEPFILTDGKQSVDMSTGKHSDAKITRELGNDNPTTKMTDDKTTGKLNVENSLKNSVAIPSRKHSTNKPIGEDNTGMSTKEQSSDNAIREQTTGKTRTDQHDSQQGYSSPPQCEGPETGRQTVGKSDEGKSTESPKPIKDGFYIRLKMVPAGVKTACEILSLYTDDGGQGKIATLVRDHNRVGVSAYVLFDELEHRDSALEKCQFSMRCTASGMAIRLTELESEYEILQSTENGGDRVMSAEERDSLGAMFNQW